MLLPLSDENHSLARPAYVTLAFLVLNIALFAYQELNTVFTMGWSMIPREITNGTDLIGPMTLDSPSGPTPLNHVAGPTPIYLTLLSSMFMHGSWSHLGGNMLYLWIFGDNIEHRFGHTRFLIFYLLSGLAASATQIALNPESIIPNLGASGAIAGILGCYLVLFPRNRVNALLVFKVVTIPAFVVLGLWGALQIWQGVNSLQSVGIEGGVAYGAHVGGFVAGCIFGLIVRFGMKNQPLHIYRPRPPRSLGNRRP